ncbi:MAG: glycosyltransferase [Planctomycetota bacterium]|jgi:glycosyltransferase involved in cell wall biosynthesis
MGKQIVFVIDRVGAGGAGGVILRLARGLRERGHKAQIIAIKPRANHLVRPDDEVFVLPDYTWFRIWSPPRRWLERRALVRQLKELAPGGDISKIDAIFGFLPNAHKALHQCGLPQDNIHYSVRMSMKGQILHASKIGKWREYWVERRIKRYLEGKSIVTCAKALTDELFDLGISPKRACHIYVPFDIEQTRALAAQDAPVPDEDYIIHMGRDHTQKRHDILLRAFRKVEAPVKLVLLGRHSDRIPEMIKELGLEDRVQLAGFQQNPYPWVRHAKLLVCSSEYEGLGNSLVEALICGTPVVSTDCPTGPSEVLTGPLAHCLVPNTDVDALAAKIDEVLADPPDVTNAPILDLITMDKICEQFLEVAETGGNRTADVAN